MTSEEQEKISDAEKKILKLPQRDLGGIYKDEVCDYEEIKKQITFLTNLIVLPPKYAIDEENKRLYFPLKFKVVDNECSFGKSTVALHGMIKYYSYLHNRDNKILWVTERIEDCEENAKKLNELTEIQNFAISITKDVPRDLREEYIRKYDVIFITHERYRRLARYYNADEREAFKYGKFILIIDEKLNMQSTISFCKTKYYELIEEIKNLIGEEKWKEAKKIYNKIVNPLLMYLNKTSKKDVYKKGLILTFNANIKEIEENIDKLKAIIKANADEDLIYEDFEDKEYQTIYEKIEDLREFYMGRCIADVMNYSKISEVVLQVPNYSMEMWGVSNNIVLDATASIDLSYEYRKDIFQLLHQKRVFNHKYWNIHYLQVNCTTYGRTNLYTNFYEVINEIIREYGEDTFFVMANLYDDEEPTYKGSKQRRKKHIFLGTVNHQGNLNGRNDFKEKTNYINADYIYENDRSYILKYLYYNRKAEIENWRSVQGKFLDEELEIFKIYEVARNLYQSIKRINRDMKYCSNVFFLSHREEITKLTLDMLEGANIIHDKEIEKRFLVVEKENKKKETKKITEFQKLCNSILNNEIPGEFKKLLETEKFSKYKASTEKGKFAKCLFYTVLDMTNKSFGNNVLNDKNGITKKFLEKKGIENTNGKYLIFPNFLIKK